MAGHKDEKSTGGKERRAQALRDNLHRRKAQARGRAQAEAKPAAPDRGGASSGKPKP